MSDEVCLERHKRIDEKLEKHDKRLDDHDIRLDKLEQDGRELKIEIKNLCENLRSLTNIMKWFVMTLGGSLVGFFFYAIQNSMFK
jgi:hypothetical protein